MRAGSASSRGFTYVGLLLAIALLGVGLLAVSELWVRTAHRQRLAQMEWAGAQWRQAIGSYYESPVDGRRAFPASLDQLLEDRRTPFVRRHLRRLYANPFAADGKWELVRAPDGGVRAVRAEVPGVGEAPPAVREFGYLPASAR